MDIETQKQFLITEKQKHVDALAALQAIEDTLTDKIAPIVASIIPLQTAKEYAEARVLVLSASNEALSTDKDLLIKQITDAGLESVVTQTDDVKVEPLPLQEKIL